MKKFEVSIEGASPILQNRLSRELNKEIKQIPNSNKEDWEDNNWQKKLYKDEQGRIVFPDLNVHAMLQSAARAYKVPPPRDVGRTWTAYIKSSVVVEKPAVIESQNAPKPFGTMVNGNPSNSKKSSKVYKVRPMIDLPWKSKITFLDMNDYLSKAVVTELMRTAGLFVGMSDWRPQFGRFTVKTVTEEKMGA